MNGAHLHLIVNHLPIVFPLVGILVMLMVLISKSEAIERTAYTIFIIGAITSIAAMTTGEGAEEVVEKIGGISENMIEQHEDMAKTFAFISYLLGFISIIGLWVSFKQKNIGKFLSIGTLLLAFILMFFAKQAGTSGGEIRHTEIRSGNQPNTIETNLPDENDDE